MPNHSICPIDRKASDKPEMGDPLLSTEAIPKAIVIVPRVATNAGILAKETSSPFNDPNTVPVRIPTTAAATAIDGSSCCATSAAATPLRPATLPTDNSLPPD